MVKPIVSSVVHPSSDFHVWDSVDLEYLGPIKVEENVEMVGGGRRIVASIPLGVGEVLLVEKPFVLWRAARILPVPCENIPASFAVETLWGYFCSILESNELCKVLHELKLLFPVELHHVSQKTRDFILRIFEPSIRSVIQQYDLEFDEAFRLLLAIHFNAFSSGLYLHSAMINHSCAPNAVRFFNGRTSTVYSISNIAIGQEITLTYLFDALEMTQAKKDKMLEHQFDMRCLCNICILVRENDKIWNADEIEQLCAIEENLDEISAFVSKITRNNNSLNKSNYYLQLTNDCIKKLNDFPFVNDSSLSNLFAKACRIKCSLFAFNLGTISIEQLNDYHESIVLLKNRIVCKESLEMSDILTEYATLLTEFNRRKTNVSLLSPHEILDQQKTIERKYTRT